MSQSLVPGSWQFSAEIWLANFIRILTDDRGYSTAAAYSCVYRWLVSNASAKKLKREEIEAVMAELQLHVQAMEELLDA